MKRNRIKPENSLNIIIVGCGKIGENLAQQLAEQGNNITVIDASRERVKEVCASCDCMGVVGNGATHETQIQAGIRNADLLIAVTGSDELNILCCLMAKKESDCETIARVKNPEYSSETKYLKDELGLAMVINPQNAAAEEIARVLRFPCAMNIDTFAGGRVELVKFRLPEDSPLVGMSVREVVSALKCDVLICTVERGEEAFIAKANLKFEARDIVIAVAFVPQTVAFIIDISFHHHASLSKSLNGASSFTKVS